MRVNTGVLLLLAVGLAQASAQRPEGTPPGAPRNELAAGYRHVDSTGSSIGFTLDGGFLAYSRQFLPLLGFATEAAQTRTSNVGGAGGSFTLLTLGTGPRVGISVPHGELFGQALFGVAHGSQVNAGLASGSAAITTHMVQFGGGLNVRLGPRFSLRAIDVEELITSFAEATSSSQRHLTLGTGLVWRFSGHLPQRPVEYLQDDLTEIYFTCGTDTPVIAAGGQVKVLGHATTQPDLISLNYAWTSTGGTVTGTGREVTLDTSGLAAGRYRVSGVASLVSSPQTTRNCAFTLQVLPGSGASASQAPRLPPANSLN